MEKQYEPWDITVKKRLIEKNITITDLAKAIGFSRVYVSYVINGQHHSNSIKKLICDELELSYGDMDRGDNLG